jgi:hypothetical protein
LIYSIKSHLLIADYAYRSKMNAIEVELCVKIVVLFQLLETKILLREQIV